MAIKFTVQGLLIYSAMLAYALGFFFAVFRWRKIAGFTYFAGFAVAVAAFVYRWIHVSHVPMQNLFEVFITLGMLIYPITVFSRKVLKIGAGPCNCADMLIGFIVLFPAGFVFKATPQQLPPALQCWLFAPHVAVYMLSYMVMAKAAYLAFGEIFTSLKYSSLIRFIQAFLSGICALVISIPALIQTFPDIEFASIFQAMILIIKFLKVPLSLSLAISICVFLLGKYIFAIFQIFVQVFFVWTVDDKGLLPYEDASYKMVTVGFPFLTLGLLLGSWWGKLAWGDYWGWDPKELWSLVSWLVYVGYFHFRIMYGKKYPRANSLWVILGMTAIIITLLWVNLSKIFSGMHSYAM